MFAIARCTKASTVAKSYTSSEEHIQEASNMDTQRGTQTFKNTKVDLGAKGCNSARIAKEWSANNTQGTQAQEEKVLEAAD